VLGYMLLMGILALNTFILIKKAKPSEDTRPGIE
jgi:hypothetical protein